MNSMTHPFEKEEVMAYLDGELPVERAAVVADHLERCPECRALVADFRLVSGRLSAWAVELSPESLGRKLTAALEARAQSLRGAAVRKLPTFQIVRGRARAWRWRVGLAATLATIALVVAISIPNLLRSRVASNRASAIAQRGMYVMTDEGSGGSGAAPPEAHAGPMIARTASLEIIARDFDGARPAIEATVRRHAGYIAQLRVMAQSGMGRTLYVTLRVPTDQLGPVLNELKALGRVEQETQSGEEVTQEHVDFVARLANARATEQRLMDILRQRTGKVGDVLAVEREIARVRGEIEQMEAGQKTLENRVEYASVEVRVIEQFKAELEISPPSTPTLLRNAAIEGYHSFVQGALDLILFSLRYGPVLLFWGLLMFWPARRVWRRVRATRQ